MRARNIKPSLFKNEELADLGPYAVVLFEGLWCIADREGRLEDRPRRIKAEIMPYWDVDVDDLLNELYRSGFIIRYEVDKQRFIQVVNFTKHQYPHVKESVSTIPAPEEHGASTVLAPDKPSKGSHGKNETQSSDEQQVAANESPKQESSQREVAAEQKSPQESQKTEHGASTVPALDKPAINPPESPILNTESPIKSMATKKNSPPSTPDDRTTKNAQNRAFSTEQQPTNPPRTRTVANDMWDAFATTLGTQPRTKSERGKWNGAIKELVDAEITPEEVPRLVKAYRRTYQDIDCNPRAIANNLSAVMTKNGSHAPPKQDRDKQKAEFAALLAEEEAKLEEG